MFAESIHTAPSSCKVKAGTVVPLRLAPSGFPALAPWGVCACGLSREVCLRKVFLLDAIFFGAHLLEPPRPAPFPEHMSTLEVQLERSGGFLQTAASCVGNPGRLYISLRWFWPRWELLCECADTDCWNVYYLSSIFSYHFLQTYFK